MANLENQVSYVSAGPERGFTYSREPYIPSKESRGSHLADPIKPKSFNEMSKDLSDIKTSLNINAGRLRLLEERKRAREAARIPLAKVNQKSIEDGDKVWLREMLSLGGQTEEGQDTYQARKDIHEGLRDQKLNPSEAKGKYRQDKSDDAWVDEMLALGGQEKE